MRAFPALGRVGRAWFDLDFCHGNGTLVGPLYFYTGSRELSLQYEVNAVCSHANGSQWFCPRQYTVVLFCRIGLVNTMRMMRGVAALEMVGRDWLDLRLLVVSW